MRLLPAADRSLLGVRLRSALKQELRDVQRSIEAKRVAEILLKAFRDAMEDEERESRDRGGRNERGAVRTREDEEREAEEKEEQEQAGIKARQESVKNEEMAQKSGDETGYFVEKVEFESLEKAAKEKSNEQQELEQKDGDKEDSEQLTMKAQDKMVVEGESKEEKKIANDRAQSPPGKMAEKEEDGFEKQEKTEREQAVKEVVQTDRSGQNQKRKEAEKSELDTFPKLKDPGEERERVGAGKLQLAKAKIEQQQERAQSEQEAVVKLDKKQNKTEEEAEELKPTQAGEGRGAKVEKTAELEAEAKEEGRIEGKAMERLEKREMEVKDRVERQRSATERAAKEVTEQKQERQEEKAKVEQSQEAKMRKVEEKLQISQEEIGRNLVTEQVKRETGAKMEQKDKTDRESLLKKELAAKTELERLSVARQAEEKAKIEKLAAKTKENEEKTVQVEAVKAEMEKIVKLPQKLPEEVRSVKKVAERDLAADVEQERLTKQKPVDVRVDKEHFEKAQLEKVHFEKERIERESLPKEIAANARIEKDLAANVEHYRLAKVAHEKAGIVETKMPKLGKEDEGVARGVGESAAKELVPKTEEDREEKLELTTKDKARFEHDRMAVRQEKQEHLKTISKVGEEVIAKEMVGNQSEQKESVRKSLAEETSAKTAAKELEQQRTEPSERDGVKELAGGEKVLTEERQIAKEIPAKLHQQHAADVGDKQSVGNAVKAEKLEQGRISGATAEHERFPKTTSEQRSVEEEREKAKQRFVKLQEAKPKVQETQVANPKVVVNMEKEATAKELAIKTMEEQKPHVKTDQIKANVLERADKEVAKEQARLVKQNATKPPANANSDVIKTLGQERALEKKAAILDQAQKATKAEVEPMGQLQTGKLPQAEKAIKPLVKAPGQEQALEKTAAILGQVEKEKVVANRPVVKIIERQEQEVKLQTENGQTKAAVLGQADKVVANRAAGTNVAKQEQVATKQNETKPVTEARNSGQAQKVTKLATNADVKPMGQVQTVKLPQAENAIKPLAKTLGQGQTLEKTATILGQVERVVANRAAGTNMAKQEQVAKKQNESKPVTEARNEREKASVSGQAQKVTKLATKADVKPMGKVQTVKLPQAEERQKAILGQAENAIKPPAKTRGQGQALEKTVTILGQADKVVANRAAGTNVAKQNESKPVNEARNEREKAAVLGQTEKVTKPGSKVDVKPMGQVQTASLGHAQKVIADRPVVKPIPRKEEHEVKLHTENRQTLGQAEKATKLATKANVEPMGQVQTVKLPQEKASLGQAQKVIANRPVAKPIPRQEKHEVNSQTKATILGQAEKATKPATKADVKPMGQVQTVKLPQAAVREKSILGNADKPIKLETKADQAVEKKAAILGQAEKVVTNRPVVVMAKKQNETKPVTEAKNVREKAAVLGQAKKGAVVKQTPGQERASNAKNEQTFQKQKAVANRPVVKNGARREEEVKLQTGNGQTKAAILRQAKKEAAVKTFRQEQVVKEQHATRRDLENRLNQKKMRPAAASLDKEKAVAKALTVGKTPGQKSDQTKAVISGRAEKEVAKGSAVNKTATKEKPTFEQAKQEKVTKFQQDGAKRAVNAETELKRQEQKLKSHDGKPQAAGQAGKVVPKGSTVQERAVKGQNAVRLAAKVKDKAVKVEPAWKAILGPTEREKNKQVAKGNVKEASVGRGHEDNATKRTAKVSNEQKAPKQAAKLQQSVSPEKAAVLGQTGKAVAGTSKEKSTDAKPEREAILGQAHQPTARKTFDKSAILEERPRKAIPRENKVTKSVGKEQAAKQSRKGHGLGQTGFRPNNTATVTLTLGKKADAEKLPTGHMTKHVRSDRLVKRK